MGVAGQSVSGDLMAEIVEFGFGEASFDKGPGVNAR